MSSNKTVIAVDAMGGDLGPSVVVPGAIEAARQTGAKILLVGNEATLDGELNRLSPSGVDLEIVHAPEVAGMDEKPSDILRRKKNASIQVACRLVRDGAAQGVVSAGHSGASVACGMFIMGRIPGVERPALASLLPTEKEPVVLLDVGATVDCKPYNIFQFGLMGDAFARDILNKEAPRVGLLSIGEEEGKGNSQVKEAYELFKMAQNLNFSGNIEGRDLFTGDVDVAVCDGFVGNVVLKLTEGVAKTLLGMLKKIFLQNLITKLSYLGIKGGLGELKRMMDSEEVGGAPLLGAAKPVIKAHGSSHAKGIKNAIRQAKLCVANDLCGTMQTALAAVAEKAEAEKAEPVKE